MPMSHSAEGTRVHYSADARAPTHCAEDRTQELREFHRRHAAAPSSSVVGGELKVHLWRGGVSGCSVCPRASGISCRLTGALAALCLVGPGNRLLHHVQGLPTLVDVLPHDVIILHNVATEYQALPVRRDTELVGDELLQVRATDVTRNLELRRRPIDAPDVYLVCGWISCVILRWRRFGCRSTYQGPPSLGQRLWCRPCHPLDWRWRFRRARRVQRGYTRSTAWRMR
mmetsp:Transcript_66744/g.186073  ORF Transcript_66744/g.186073 Transcript_66744/m.186073 type:complete len:228 (+) Transcript_66744:1805-2488(+)